jgi:hypothetical protein
MSEAIPVLALYAFTVWTDKICMDICNAEKCFRLQSYVLSISMPMLLLWRYEAYAGSRLPKCRWNKLP